ncbi:MAG: hypothetical protein KatS3mg060_1736 [Dehalococcoidia bacterium]|nr:MAG: hypothetical protein KatS3mg060_1736 [Dehalococcoidia bacterium]
MPPEMRPDPRRAHLSAGVLRRLEWSLRRPLANRLGGDQRSVQRGAGIELTEVREYQPGDDVRQIDWNITARTDRPHVRESFVERALDVWLLIDLSASVDWGTARMLKRDQAADFAAVASALLTGRGNRVGVVTFADRIGRVIPPGAGRPHLLHLTAAVDAAPGQMGRAPTDLTGALDHAGRMVRRRSLLIVVSDFLAPSGWQRPLRRLAHRHEVVAVRIADPREGELPDVGLLTVEDPETGRQLLVDTGDRRLRERFRSEAQVQAAALESEIRAAGAELLTLSTDDDLMPALVRFLGTRRIRRGVPHR